MKIRVITKPLNNYNPHVPIILLTDNNNFNPREDDTLNVKCYKDVCVSTNRRFVSDSHTNYTNSEYCYKTVIDINSIWICVFFYHSNSRVIMGDWLLKKFEAYNDVSPYIVYVMGDSNIENRLYTHGFDNISCGASSAILTLDPAANGHLI